MTVVKACVNCGASLTGRQQRYCGSHACRRAQKNTSERNTRPLCECGQPKAHGNRRCQGCHDAHKLGRKYGRWTLIAALRRHGLTLRQIAAELGSTKGSIQVETVRMRQSGFPIDRKRPRPVKLDVEQLRALHAEGLTATEIADRLNCSAKGAGFALHRIGLRATDPRQKFTDRVSTAFCLERSLHDELRTEAQARRVSIGQVIRERIAPEMPSAASSAAPDPLSLPVPYEKPKERDA